MNPFSANYNTTVDLWKQMRAAILYDNRQLDPSTDELQRVFVIDAHIVIDGSPYARFDSSDDAETVLVQSGFTLDFRDKEGSTIWRAEPQTRIEIQQLNDPHETTNPQTPIHHPSDRLSIYPTPGVSPGHAQRRAL
jgi:hypothetical protein